MKAIDSQVLDRIGVAQKPAKKADELGQKDFLKLMTTQLNNQDPMKPMASGEFYSQIAQFSSVAGIQALQKSFAEVASAMFSSQALQASSMVGREVLVPGSSQYAGESGLKGAVDLPADGAAVTLSIHDAAGTLVRRVDLGRHAAGMVPFAWDGRNTQGQAVSGGNYEVRATARVDGRETALDTYFSDRVNSVTIEGEGKGVSLNLAREGALPLSEVKQIR